MANLAGPPDVVKHKNQVLNDWCARLGRDPAEIERTSNIAIAAIDRMDQYVAAGAQRLHVQLDHPFDMRPVEQALEQRARVVAG
jgi:hypothetical protein